MTGPFPLVGRDRERAQLEQFLAKTRSGRSAVLVVRGATGIGKTALLDHAARTALDHRVVRVCAAVGEANLPYSALHLLCSALADHVRQLEPHHRHALETAAGLRPGPAPDRLLAGVATFALFTVAAETRPVLCVADNAQWLDEVSAFVLAFVASRLGTAPVALLFANRADTFPGLPELLLDGLTPEDARQLLDRVLAAPMDSDVAERIVVEARGNPRAIVESVHGALTGELAGGYRVVADAKDALPLLDSRAALLLLLAAAEPVGDPARLWRAAGALGIDAGAAERLESARLVSFGTRVVFRDPRLRSSVYGHASAEQRRRVHGALAGATDHTTEPDRHAWHRALSLVEPDDAVGDELERTARIARGQGGLAAVAAFLERSALCTADPSRRARRAIMAADAHHSAGAADAATRLLAATELGQLDTVNRAHLTRLRARIALDTTRCRAAVAQLLAAADDLELWEPRSALSAYFEALGAAIFTGHRDVTRTALARIAGQQPRRTDRLLDGVAQRCADDFAVGVEPLKLALKTLHCDHEDDPRARLLACLVAPELWDDDTWQELTRTEVERAREVGARTILPNVLTHRALFEVHSGQFAIAESLVAEALAITEAAGTTAFPHAACVLAAWRGRQHPTLDSAGHDGAGMDVVIARYAKAVLCNGLGAYADAVAAARRAITGDGVELRGWSLAELVEAAVRSGALDTAAEALDQLSERAVLSGTEWALGVAARARALLAGDAEAEDLYVEAIDRLGRSLITVHLGRARLVYGEWLRRQGRRVDARVQLRAAQQSFTDMGAEAFAGRATRELLATGERARRRVEETRDQLTPQETQVASLARDGRSNPEIARLLSISPRTVEYHLHKVFTKLRIASRTELHLVLAAARDRAEPER